MGLDRMDRPAVRVDDLRSWDRRPRFTGPGEQVSGTVLELYQAEGCPHCAKVRDKLTDLGASYVIHNPRLPGGEGGDVLNEQTYDEMTELGGQDQIPYLVDTRRSETLYESDDIVEYLEEHYG